MLIKDIMSSPAICMDQKSTIKETIDVMAKNDLGFLPITKNDHLIGVVTDRDILLRGKEIKSNSKITKVMTSDPLYTIRETDTLLDAAKIMSTYKVRRLVVVNSDYIQGVVTSKDLLKDETLIPYIKDTYTPNYY